MYILHIETATNVCSVALSKDNSLVEYIDMNEGMNHAAKLAPAIQRLLKSNAISFTELTAISVSSGPGSYTGLRVGSSTAKALAYSLNIPLVGVPTLLALANAVVKQFEDAKFILPMLDARRREVYTTLYSHTLEEIWPVSSLVLTEEFFKENLSGLGKIYSCGDGSLKIGELASLAKNLEVHPEIECSARHLVAPAWELLAKGKTYDPMRYVPYYMKPPNITQSKKAGSY